MRVHELPRSGRKRKVTGGGGVKISNESTLMP